MKKILRWLDDNFYLIMAIVSAIGFVIGVLFAHYSIDSIEKRNTEAVVTGVLTVHAAEYTPEPTLPEPALPTPPVPPAQQRTYFDVPLDHDVQEHIYIECEKHNIQPAIIVAMIEQESDFNIYCLGDDGRSAGLMQIQAKWHLKRMIALDCTDLFDPYQNITVGIDYLAELLNRYDGDIACALTAYNQGHYKGTITNYAKEILRKADEYGNNRD
jgi:soluble lytic murein transglycosylase-like protein